ncbi:hypothetical protein [Aureispira sp. CCB-QB1]|uniref:hypothetical protein n=1 Tax=Aureispira sp. CCB-QB1 TaxID=1313421 RepID=UPI000696472E|nr:hypothetical protein [Aureispira sp. CCB-QB1]
MTLTFKTPRLLLVTLLLHFCLFAIGQTTKIDSILASTEIESSLYEPKINSGQLLLLKMAYGSIQIQNKQDLKQLEGAHIVSIDLLYSNHPKSGDFSQLIKKRLQSLQQLSPELFQNYNIHWRLVRQTNCSDQSSAQKLFHGFVITYRPLQKEEHIEKEIEYLKTILSDQENKLTTASSDLALESDDPPTPLYDTMVGSNGELLFRLGSGKKDSVQYDKDMEQKKAQQLKKSSHSWDDKPDEPTPSELYNSFVTPKRDVTILNVLKRNDWKKMLIVADVTGSMSPYTGQLLMWLRFNTIDDKVKHFVFFNDGNRKNSFEKEIGKTGGIYNIPSSEYQAVENLVYESMRNGNGGDRPENDLEALIEAVKLCPDCENIVLIADNWSSIKDFRLLKKFKKPVKVILCGTDVELNTQYLDLARATGGSVHTMEDDLVHLMDMKEGEVIKFGNDEYIIEHGKFVQLRKI